MSVTFRCADAIPWLRERREVGSIITSLPDQIETDMTPWEWRKWFVEAIALCMKAASAEAVTVIYQTDRKVDGKICSKAELIFVAAELAGVECLWHKIVLRRKVGGVDLFRPTYSHMIAFSKEAKPGRATPDVMERGGQFYKNAIGFIPAKVALELAQRCDHRVVDPFCGRGTIPILADQMDMEAIGSDIDPGQIREAQGLLAELSGTAPISA